MSTFRGSRIPVNPRKPTQFPRLHTSHERIPIFMIQDKDASTPCDGRHVKYRRNTNVLTQKKTGGKRIMGNQGMTNWKFRHVSCYRVNPRCGAVRRHRARRERRWKNDFSSNTSYKPVVDTPQVLVAGDTAILEFTYMAFDDNDTPGFPADDTPINMNGGRVRLNIEANWKFGVGAITSIMDDKTPLYLAGARLREGQEPPVTGIRGPIPKDSRNQRRIHLTLDGDNVTWIEVDLDATAWNIDRTDTTRALTITLGTADAGIAVPIPASLKPSAGIPYQSYWFGVASAAAGSSPTSLGSYKVADSSLPVPPRPIIRVGNIASGTTAITPSANPATSYIDDEGNFVVRFTALGPIYDVDVDNDGVGNDDINARIVVTLPANNVLASTSTADPVPSIPQTIAPRASGYVSVRTLGGVTPVRPDVQIVGNNEVTIDFKTMNKDGVIELTYHDVKVAAATVAGANIFTGTVASNTNSPVLFGGAGVTQAREGSGTVKINTSAVEIDTYQSSITITYTAAADIEGAYLIVQIPTGAFKMPDRNPITTEDDTTFIDLVLRNADAERVNEHATAPYGDVTPVRSGDITQELINDGTAILWGPLALKKDRTFVGTIRRVRITETTGTYAWTAHLVIPDDEGRPSGVPNAGDASEISVDPLYVLQAEQNPIDPDVTFEITEAVALPLSTAGATDTLRTAGPGGFGYYDAAGRYRITFKFTAVRTPIKDGVVTVDLPDGWSPPKTDKGVLGYTMETYAKEWTDDDVIPDPQAPVLAVSGQKITITKLDLDRVGEDNTNAPNSITIVYGQASSPADAETDDMLGALAQADAGDEVIKTTFDVGGGNTIRPSPSNEISLTVGNVAAGSGTATIRPSSVEAGSVVSVTVAYKAQGTMDGGQVVLQMPDGWGDLQKDDADEENYVQVTASGGTVGEWFTNEDVVDVNLGTFDENDTVRFALTNVVAQPSNLGVANFTIYSAGKAGETLSLVVGEEPPDGAYTNVGTDLSKLLGRVYRTDCLDDGVAPEPDDYNGLLRVAVTGGGDGSGTVEVDIVDSEQGSGIYIVINDDGEEEEQDIPQLHAGDGASAYLRFTYTPIETIIDGELKFIRPFGMG